MANRCDQCGEEFPSTAALVQHFSSHSGGSNSGEGERAQPTPRGNKGGAVRSATASASRGSVGKDSRVKKAKISTPISWLPREMIGKIFSYLEIPDIVNCANTCKEWEDIAQLYFQPFLIRLSNYDRKAHYDLRDHDWSVDCSDSKLISTLFESSIINYYGRVITVDGFPNIAEVIDLLDPNFRQKVSFEVSGSLTGKEYEWCKGFLMGEKILLHGYDYIDDIDFLCVLGQSKVGIRFTAKDRRGASGIIKIDESTLLSVGGGPESNAMDIIHFDPANEENPFTIKEGPEFPYEIYGHAMIQHIPGEINVIGGRIFRIFDDGVSGWLATRKTWIIDTKNQFSVTEGPELCEERSHHSVGVMNPGCDHSRVIVVGGSSQATVDILDVPKYPSDYVLQSAEFLDDIKGQWELVYTGDYEKLQDASNDSLKFVDEPIMEMAMIQSPDECGVVIFGTGIEGNNLKELRSGEWINLEQTLKFIKDTQVAIPIPYGFCLSTIEG